MILSLEELLKQDLTNKTIVFPTDTVYGLGCLLMDEVATRKIFELKERDFSKPLAVLAASFDQVVPLVENPDELKPLSDKYWPGALTVVVSKTDRVMDLTTANNPTVGIRIPDHPTANAILSHFGAMAVTSLNRSGEPSIVKWADALRYVDKVDYIVGGEDLSSPPSTVYDLGKKQTLRQGSIIIEP